MMQMYNAYINANYYKVNNMSQGTKNINIEISIECWRELKKISIDKDTKLQQVVKEILEKRVSKKSTTEGTV